MPRRDDRVAKTPAAAAPRGGERAAKTRATSAPRRSDRVAITRTVSGQIEAPATKYERIYAVVTRIPRGRIATYGQVAVLAGLPGHARMVGYALHSTPANKRLPWHRVIGASGRVSLPRESGGALQEALLRKERVFIADDGRVDLDRYQWRPRA